MKSLCRIKALGLLWTLLFVLGASFIGSYPALAQEPGQMEKAAVAQEAGVDSRQWQVYWKSPGVEIVSQGIQNPGEVVTAKENPVEVAENWLAEKGFEEGRNLYKGKLLYFSIGSAVINARPDAAGFIDSRYMAFQRAELMAKAKTAIFLGVDLTTSRGSSEREINPKERAELERIVNTSPTLKKNIIQKGIADDVYRLFQKAGRLAEAKLDHALTEAGVDIEAETAAIKRERARKKAKQNRSQLLRRISEASLTAAACAFADVQGMQVFQTFEGSMDDGYQVVVITLWSQNLQRLVDSMRSGIAPHRLPYKRAKQEVTRQLPRDPKKLACLSGVRAYINQHGEHVLLAFGQSGVEVIGGRKDKAYELADKKARLRALAAMRNFMGEKVAFKNVEELREVLALYAKESAQGQGSSEYRSISQFSEMISAAAKKQRITGIHGLKTFRLLHPFTDKPMVLKVMAWSPQSQAMAEEVKQMIRHGADSLQQESPATASPPARPKTPSRKGIISGKGGDLDAI